MNWFMDWSASNYLDNLNKSTSAWSWLGSANIILTIFTLGWMLSLIVCIVALISYGISNSKYKAQLAELNNLRKERKRIKRNLDRLENPNANDFDDLHDIDDDIEEKQKAVNQLLSKKNGHGFIWKLFLFLFIICLGVRVVLWIHYNKKATDQMLGVGTQGTESTLDNLGPNNNGYNPWDTDNSNGSADDDYINQYYYEH